MPESTKQNNSNIPGLSWDEFYWQGEVNLPSWAGTQARGGAYGAVDSSSPSVGIYSLMLEPEDGEQPAYFQEMAYEYLLKNENIIYKKVIEALLKKYPDWYSIFNEYVAESGEEMPKSMDSLLIAKHTGIANVHILPVEHEGMGYIGFELGCSWDKEHGIGVMLHGDRIIDVGGADTAFLSWIAERDKKGVPIDSPPKGVSSKKWWQIWK